ncbi:MAG: phosphate/phosphite/phosphonate ABC transporter substrate-binding protein [Magnetospirillum sp.]|nr:MAG: phosphate/phosphite/phosphonate ABC transporter substrate-binding protein [Magnetospirillum sp.]
MRRLISNRDSVRRRGAAGVVVARLALAISLWLAATAGEAVAQGYKPGGKAKAEDSLIFGIHPYSNPQDLFEAYEPVARYLEGKVPGIRIEIEASRDYADFEAKLAAGHFHLALPNPYETVLSLQHGYGVVAKMTPDDDFRGLIIARKDRHIRTLRQLAGKTVSFPSPTAVAATMLPLWVLHGQGLDVGKTVQAKFVGSQFSSLLNAYAGDVDACGSTVRFWRVWSRDNAEKAAEMEVVARTDSLPHNGVVVRHDVDKVLAARLAEALAGMDSDPNLDQSRFKQDQAHFELANDAAYQPVREFLARYDQAIGLPGSMRPFGW